MATELDQQLMRRAIALARERLGQTWPNPVVGCVIAGGDGVGDGEVLSEAATGPGGPDSASRRLHAEEQALLGAGATAKGATAYVTLEPCAKRSSDRASCTDRLIAAEIARIVVACRDPSPLAAGEGFERLRAAGVEVEMDLLAVEAADLYAGYRRRLATGLPLIEASTSGAGFDARFEPMPGESLPAAMRRLGQGGYTRLWVEAGGLLEQTLREQALLN